MSRIDNSIKTMTINNVIYFDLNQISSFLNYNEQYLGNHFKQQLGVTMHVGGYADWNGAHWDYSATLPSCELIMSSISTQDAGRSEKCKQVIKMITAQYNEYHDKIIDNKNIDQMKLQHSLEQAKLEQLKIQQQLELEKIKLEQSKIQLQLECEKTKQLQLQSNINHQDIPPSYHE